MSTKRYVFGPCGCCHVAGPQMVWKQRFPINFRTVVDNWVARPKNDLGNVIEGITTTKFSEPALTRMLRLGPEHTFLSPVETSGGIVNPYVSEGSLSSEPIFNSRGQITGFVFTNGAFTWYAASSKLFEPGSYVIEVTSQIDKPLVTRTGLGGEAPFMAITATPFVGLEPQGAAAFTQQVSSGSAIFYPVGTKPPVQEARFGATDPFRFVIQPAGANTDHFLLDSDAIWTITIAVTQVITARDA